MPVFGKIEELGHLDDFVWATLHGWGILPARRIVRSLLSVKADEDDPAAAAQRLANELKADEEQARLVKFTDDQAQSDYPYLFSLVAVRLWAMVEAAARELVIEGVKQPIPLPRPGALAKLKGPIAPFVGADAALQAELVADALWHSVEGQYLGTERYDAVLDRIGFAGDSHNTIREILVELSEVRHCVVHRDGFADRRLLATCPWLCLSVGARLPATTQRYWFYRTAVYGYVMDLLRRWAVWRKVPQMQDFANSMETTVLAELEPAWKEAKRYLKDSQLTLPVAGA
jgi:hypothetical protein